MSSESVIPPVVHASVTCRGAPIQIEGTINGKPFYFRARFTHWAMVIAEDADDLMDAFWGQAPALFYRRQSYGTDEDFAASYMPIEEAMAAIQECARAFAMGQTG